MGLKLQLLGPVEAWDEDRRIELGPRKQRLVLAVLGLEAGKPVELSRLVDLAWPDSPPRTAAHAIQVCVSGLRSALRDVADVDIRLHGDGYALAADPMTIDAHRFRSLLARARGTADDTNRVELLDRALALWSGTALAGVAATQTRQRLCAGLEEARLGALEDRLDGMLRLGRDRELLDELPGLVASHPLRERLVGQLMIALHRDGRAAEALAGFRRYRERLAEELGLDAGPALRQLELAILRNDASALMPARPRSEAGLAAGPVAGPVGGTAAGPLADGPRDAPVPAQLPAAVAGFAGRAEALAELDAVATTRPPAGPIVVIAGTAGVGKTALAVHWAHRHRDAFPDGQLYVNLAGFAPGSPMSPQRALTGFLRAFGVPAERIPVEADEAAALYRSLLADRRVLVVLDNAHAPDQVRPLLPAGPGCLTVITSRDQLTGLTAKDGAALLALGVLRIDEALALLTSLLGAGRIDAEPVAAAHVAALCACLPLALRIAAAHLTRHPRQPVADLAVELREGNRLAMLSVAGDDESAVRAAFDLSYSALQPTAQRMFMLAGLAPGADLSTRAAAALAAADVADAREVLADLARAHLVDEQAPGRFAMHDLLRLYAGDRASLELTAAERDAAAARLCDFYLRATDAAARVLHPNMQRLGPPAPPGVAQADDGVVFGTHTDALSWLEAERPNLVTAVTWAAGHGHREAAWLLADAMRGYLWMRRYAADWLAVGAAGLTAATDEAQPRAMAAAHLSLAQAKRWLARYQDAAAHLIQARDLARQAGWHQGAAAALGSLANVYRDQGRLADAAEHHQQACDIYRQTGSRGGEATSLGNLGNVLLELGRVAQALDYLNQSVAIYQEIGARPAEAHLLNSIGCAHLILGRLPEGRDHLERALALHRETGSREGEADDLNNLAELHRDAGRYQRARELAGSSLALARESGDQRIEVDANNTLGTVTRLLGDPATARRYHSGALKTARNAGYRQGEAVALIGLAEDQSEAGEAGEARASIEQALLTTRQTGLRLLEGHALTALAAIALEAGQAGECETSAAAALAVHRETGHRLGASRAERILAIVRGEQLGAALLAVDSIMSGVPDPVAASAARAAVRVAARLGVTSVADVEPVVLADGANVIVHLRPSPIVAKVAASTPEVRPDVAAWLARELDLAAFLAGAGIPVMAPSGEVPAVVHRDDGHVMSFWTFLEPSGRGRPGEAVIGSMLRDLHTALRSYPGSLPPLAPLSDIPAFLARPHTQLGETDLASIADALTRLTAELAAGSSRQQALHGDAGAGNLMATGDGWVWHDFEDTCSGPVAWDLAATTASSYLDGSRILAGYRDRVDPAQLRTCEQLRRLHLTIWYALYAERLPECRERAGELLLSWRSA